MCPAHAYGCSLDTYGCRSSWAVRSASAASSPRPASCPRRSSRARARLVVASTQSGSQQVHSQCIGSAWPVHSQCKVSIASRACQALHRPLLGHCCVGAHAAMLDAAAALLTHSNIPLASLPHT